MPGVIVSLALLSFWVTYLSWVDLLIIELLNPLYRFGFNTELRLLSFVQLFNYAGWLYLGTSVMVGVVSQLLHQAVNRESLLMETRVVGLGSYNWISFGVGVLGMYAGNWHYLWQGYTLWDLMSQLNVEIMYVMMWQLSLGGWVLTCYFGWWGCQRLVVLIRRCITRWG